VIETIHFSRLFPIQCDSGAVQRNQLQPFVNHGQLAHRSRISGAAIRKGQA